jgi:RAP1 GTPase activating protein 1
LEETIYDACSYNRFFYSKHHVNFGGVHSTEGPLVVSILKTPINAAVDEATVQNADSNHSSKSTRAQRFRVLVWSRYGEKQALVAWSQRLLGTGRPAGKRLLKALQSTSPEFLGDVNFYRLDPQEKVAEELLDMELKQVVSNYKFGILYAKEGQYKETDMFSNEHGSEAFEHFLSMIGDKVALEGWSQYRAGLDVRINATGTHSVYTTWEDYEVMFHVSTYLPYDSSNRQQLERKRHLGNDIVVLIFADGNTPYLANAIKSEFNHVFIVVQPVKLPNGAMTYRVGNTYKEGVKRFTPYLPDPNEYVFAHGPALREFLLTKLINAERAAYSAASFAAKIKRTKTMLLEGLLNDFPPPVSGS